jgi:adenine-specific DNA-methyltransferase
MFANGSINESVETAKIRDYVWYMETKQPAQMVDLADNPCLLGITGDTAYYFNYEKDKVTTLDTAFLETLNTKAGRYVMYADQCALSNETLRRWGITFKKIPRDIAKL